LQIEEKDIESTPDGGIETVNPIGGESPAATTLQSTGIIVGNITYPNAGSYQSTVEFIESGGRCGTILPPDRGNESGASRAPADCSLNQSDNLDDYAPGQVITIPVWVHIIMNDDGSQGAITNALVQSQIDVLNEDYQATAGTPGANGTDVAIQFQLAGITRTNNSAWFDACYYCGTVGGNPDETYKINLNVDPDQYLNIYTKEWSDYAGLLGYATFPQEDAGNAIDGVAINWQNFGRPALGGGPYDQGRTTTHEVGHYLGLYHTFQDGCGAAASPACYSDCDLICDTNPVESPNYGPCNPNTSCSTSDPVTNYMDYTDDACMDNFTPEQARRMRCAILNYRSSLPLPTVSDTNYGSEPDTNVYITFSEDMDDSTFTNPNISVSGSSSGSHTCTFSFSHSTHVLTIDPQTDFDYDEAVTVTIGTGVEDLAGNGLATPYVFDFPIVPYIPDTNIIISFSQDEVDIFHIVTITAEVIDDNTGSPMADTIVMFSSSLSGPFTNPDIPVSGHPLWAMTNADGIATIDWEPKVAGEAIITAEVEGFTPAQKTLTVRNPGINIDLFLTEKTRTDTSTTYQIRAIVTLDDGTPVGSEWICFDSPDIPLDECMDTAGSGEATTDITICVNEILGFRECATFAVSCGPIPEIPVFETLPVRSRSGLAWSGDGRILAGVAQSPRTVQLYNFMTQASSESGMLEDGRNIYSMRANAAGDKVAVGQSGGYLSTVDLATGTVTGPYDTGLGSLRAVDWCGSDIIVGSLNGDIGSYRPAWSENWETTTGDLELVWSVRSDGSGKFVAGDDAGNLFLYRCSDGAQLDKEPSIGGDDSWELYGTAWAPDGTQVAVAGQRFAYVYPVSATSFGSRTALTGFESTRTVFATDYVLDRNGDSTIVTGCTWVNYFAPSGGSATAISYAGDTYSLAWNPVHRILAVGYETQAKLINLSDDLLPPDISVIPGSVTVPYGTDSIVLEITVEDASFLRELTVEVNGVPILGIPPIPPEQYSASRDVEVDLNVDPNDVVIRAWDLYRTILQGQ
jgi:hypothetical protein